ncbi:MAG: hypothetical protein M1818_000575 [Claussenomyces sp. TS43310]|nr:MAG: hypothetical protein M1818_000575 [Claussenomyces sp. TS43310]
MPADATAASTAYEGKLLEAFNYIQILALALIKFSALTFYSRVFNTKHRRTAFDMLNLMTMAVVLLWAIAMLITNSLQCGTHISALWVGSKSWIVYCHPGTGEFVEAFGISNAILDVWVLVLPLPRIFQLHTTTQRKFAVSGVFLLASVGLAASLARMVIYIQSALDVLSPLADYRLLTTVQVYWSILEAGICLLAVNLPSIWIYIGKGLPEGLVASIRSVISLASLRSGGSGSRSQTRLPDGPEGSMHSSSSQAKFASSEGHEAFAEHDVQGQSEHEHTPGVIMMTSTVRQEKMIV